MICLLYSYRTWPSRVSRNFFLLRSMSRDLNCRSKELICWLTADWVTWLMWAALVKLSVSARSQNTFKLSICMGSCGRVMGALGHFHRAESLLDFAQQLLRRKRLLQIIQIILLLRNTNHRRRTNDASGGR